MKYLTGEEVLAIHSEIIDATRGMHGVRDIDLFAHIIEKPQMKFGGKELYKSVFSKAAVYVESFARHQVFVDGNKRTAIAAVARFLFLNNYEFSASNEEVEGFVMEVANKKLDVKEITDWLRHHSEIKTHHHGWRPEEYVVRVGSSREARGF